MLALVQSEWTHAYSLSLSLSHSHSLSLSLSLSLSAHTIDLHMYIFFSLSLSLYSGLLKQLPVRFSLRILSQDLHKMETDGAMQKLQSKSQSCETLARGASKLTSTVKQEILHHEPEAKRAKIDDASTAAKIAVFLLACAAGWERIAMLRFAMFLHMPHLLGGWCFDTEALRAKLALKASQKSGQASQKALFCLKHLCSSLGENLNVFFAIVFYNI